MGDQQESSSLTDLIEIPGYKGYWTDGKGAIYSTKRSPGPRRISASKHVARGRKTYRRVKVDGKAHLEHRVMAAVHVGRPLNESEVINHVDGNTTNNELSNLQVTSHKENVRHAVENNLYCSGKEWYRSRGLEVPETVRIFND